jgi:hypothetical protein
MILVRFGACFLHPRRDPDKVQPDCAARRSESAFSALKELPPGRIQFVARHARLHAGRTYLTLRMREE